MKHALAIALLTATLGTQSAHAVDAFGLQLGQPVPETRLASEIVPGNWLLTEVPNPYDGIERYTARLADDRTLCAVTANMPWSPSRAVEGKLAELENRFSETHGRPVVSRPESPSHDKMTFNQVWLWETEESRIYARRILPASGFERALSLTIESKASPQGC